MQQQQQQHERHGVGAAVRGGQQRRQRRPARRGGGAVGYTVTEVLVSLAALGAIVFGVTSMLRTTAVTFDNTRVEAFISMDAVQTMQLIVNAVREAKSVEVLSANHVLRITPPKKLAAKGYYNRNEADPANRIDFYLSDASGTAGQPGTSLWREQGGARTLIQKGVSELVFEQETPRSIQITVVTAEKAAGGMKQTRLTQRVVYLRNY